MGIFLLFQGINIKFKIISKILSEVGKSTMGIFYMHTLFLELINYFAFDYKGSLVNLLKSIIIIAICYIIVVIIKRIPIMKKLVQ